MAESNADKNAAPLSTPDELVENLDAKVTEEDQRSVLGGRKAGKAQPDYLIVKMEDIIVSS